MDELHKTARAQYDKYTEEQKREAKKFFGQFDTNGDGKLSISEFKQLVGTYDHLKLSFEYLDTDGDGKLDYEEFKTVLPFIINERPRPPAPASPPTEKQTGRKRKKIKAALDAFIRISVPLEPLQLLLPMNMGPMVAKFRDRNIGHLING